MSSEEILALQQAFLLPTYAPAIALVRGAGCRVWDAEGKEYLDFGAGISVCNIGHCHPYVSEAVATQADTLVHVSNLYANELQPQLAREISQRSFGGKVFFANSGAEANEGMIKLARKWGSDKGRHEIVCLNSSFHGRTLATLAATGQPKYRQGFGPDLPGFRFVDLNDLAALQQAITEQTAAVLIEPIQGEGGVRPASQAFLQGARELCDEHGILLLFDEVQCGMGRTGTLFAYEQFGVVPDALSLAKALGNGYPIGAFTVQRKYADLLVVGTHASTFGGTPMACAAALAVLRAIDDEQLLANCVAMGQQLRAALAALVSRHDQLLEVRGLGLMLAVVAEVPVAPIVKACADQGLLVLSAGEKVLRFLPPLTVKPGDIEIAIARLEAAVAATQPVTAGV